MTNFDYETEIREFLEKHPNGCVILIYPMDDPLGIEITKTSLEGNKLKFYENGVWINNTLGYSLVTGKHLFLDYGACAFIFEEDTV